MSKYKGKANFYYIEVKERKLIASDLTSPFGTADSWEFFF